MRSARVILFFLILLCLSTYANGQAWSGILDPSRAIDWSNVGIPGGIPKRPTVCSTISAASYGNGTGDATSGIQTALNGCPSGQVVLLSTGTFLINGNLHVPSNVTLRGQGADQTILNAKGTSGAVVTLGSGNPNTAASVPITGGALSGSTSVTVSSAGGISVGSYLLITELNDSSFVSIVGDFGSCTWCDGGIGWNGTRVLGQIVEVTSVSGTTIGISPGLYLAYPATPLATPFSASAKSAGVENLQVYANNSGYATNFAMGECAYCWISGVEGNYTDGDHVEVDWSYRSEIVNNYFSNAYLHTAGSYDSDIAIRNKSSGILVQNNILERLHASVMLEWGAAGNVIAYNYMFGNFNADGSGFLDSDINNHGAHPMFNLYEGNIGAALNFDSGWGSNSSQTTFRNWSKGTTKACTPFTGRGTVSCTQGFYLYQEDNAFLFGFLSSNVNMVGDVAGSTEQASLRLNGTGSPMPQVDTVVAICGPSPCGVNSKPYGSQALGWAWGYGTSSDSGGGTFDSLVPYSTRFFHGEYSNITGATTWSGSVTHTLPASFYLSSKPSWFGSVPWPATGPDVTGGIGPGGHAYAIPAEVCYEKVVGGTDGTGSPLTFNADKCYASGSSNAPNPPTNLKAVVN